MFGDLQESLNKIEVCLIFFEFPLHRMPKIVNLLVIWQKLIINQSVLIYLELIHFGGF